MDPLDLRVNLPSFFFQRALSFTGALFLPGFFSDLSNQDSFVPVVFSALLRGEELRGGRVHFPVKPNGAEHLVQNHGVYRVAAADKCFKLNNLQK